jgi:hypothetical protein
MADAWFPCDYVDEMMPADRASPDDWIAVMKGGHGLVSAEGPYDGQPPRPLADGEIVTFMSRTDYGSAVLTMHEDGTWAVSSEMPEGAEQVCAMDGWQTDSLATNVEECVANIRDYGGGPGTYRLSYYTFSEPIAFEFGASTGKFKEIGAVQ